MNKEQRFCEHIFRHGIYLHDGYYPKFKENVNYLCCLKCGAIKLQEYKIIKEKTLYYNDYRE